MDVSQILVELRREKDQMEEAILSLERLVAGQGKRRGRLPAWLAKASATEPAALAEATARKKWVLSEEARKRIAEAQKKRWAARNG